MERASLQEALGRKEMSEQCLVAELESLKQRLWQAAQQQAALGAENTALRSREEAWAAGAAREAGEMGEPQVRWASPTACGLSGEGSGREDRPCCFHSQKLGACPGGHGSSVRTPL